MEDGIDVAELSVRELIASLSEVEDALRAMRTTEHPPNSGDDHVVTDLVHTEQQIVHELRRRRRRRPVFTWYRNHRPAPLPEHTLDSWPLRERRTSGPVCWSGRGA